MYYKDKVIWITGASSGIGEHLVYALAEKGARLAISSRNDKELQRVKQNCHGKTDILTAPLDVADFDNVPAVAQQIRDYFGRIDMVINNAGISQRAYVKDTALQVDQKIMDVNYFGALAVTKAVLPFMWQQGSGHIVVISSVMGKIGVPGRSAYAASKHALHGYFDTLRAEVAPENIKVTVICPGYVHTNVTINALKGDGSANQQMAEATRKGLDPAVFAQKALSAIAAQKREVFIGGKEVFAATLKRLFPGLFYYLIEKIKVN